MNASFSPARFLDFSGLDALILAIRSAGYRCMGPAIENDALVLRELTGARELPRGMQAEQAPGQFKLTHDAENRYFAWANGPQAIKPYVFAPRESLWRAERDEHGSLKFEPFRPEPEKTALIGVRACDLAALTLQDAHFLEGQYSDSSYAIRRKSLFMVAVQCAEPAATCFCASTGDGPTPQSGYDLSLAELPDGFVVAAGSEPGQKVLSMLDLKEATLEQIQATKEQGEAAARKQTRSLPGRDLRSVLMNNLEHARWDEVAARCLACGNCTAVCPTCFCHAELDEPDAATGKSLHVRQWDSCFNEGHAYLHGHNVRPDIRTRYRQWLTHKLATWHEQYGRSGCVGCGRCITWCPAGIDLTEEVAAMAKGS
jgi:formate hydrogenlyase subunit 6/NADH:ubiquinone oxidoreductase subunit I